MNPFFDLQPMLFQCNADETLSAFAKTEYARLHRMSLEEGYSFLLPLNDVTDEQDNSLNELKRAGYLTMKLVYRGSEGHFLHIDLRGANFQHGPVNDISTTEKKLHPELISPFATERLAAVLTEGSQYTQDAPAKRVMSSLQRHLMKFQQDVDDGEDHLALLAADVTHLLHVDECCKRGLLPESLMDLPKYKVNEIPRTHFNQDEPYEVGEEP